MFKHVYIVFICVLVLLFMYRLKRHSAVQTEAYEICNTSTEAYEICILFASLSTCQLQFEDILKFFFCYSDQ